MPQRLTEAAIKAAIQANPLALDKTRKRGPRDRHQLHLRRADLHVPRVVELLDASIDRIHFDEAWYGYARFNPLYRDRFAMHGEPKDYPRDKPTIFATHSTHKLLAALSQASLIHVRDGRNPIAARALQRVVHDARARPRRCTRSSPRTTSLRR